MYYAVRSQQPMPDLIDNSVGLDWLRVGETETATVNRLIKSAMFWAEGFCGQPLFERVHTAQISGYTGGYLPGIDPRDVSISYTATDGTAQTWGPFTAPTETDAFKVLQSGFVRFLPTLIHPLFGTYSTLTYTAGYTAMNLPEDIQNALLLVAAYDYDHRANPVAERPTAAMHLLQPYKIYSV